MSFHKIFDSPGRNCVNAHIQMSHRKNPLELDQAAEEIKKSALDVLVISLSTSVGHFLCSVLELLDAETTISASQLEAKLHTALTEEFPENHDIVEQ
jgi:hypothetical protein